MMVHVINPNIWNAPTDEVDPAVFEQRPKVAIVLITLVFLAFATGLFWSSQANVVEVAVSQGRVVPARKVQLVQNLEGGIIDSILVAEGDRVNKGDVLVEIDSTSVGSSLGERQQHMSSLEASRIWLAAFVNGVSPDFPQQLKQEHPDLVRRGLIQFQAKTAELEALEEGLRQRILQKKTELSSARNRLENAKKQLDNAQEQYSMHKGLFREQASSRSDVLNAETRVLELQATIAELTFAISGFEGSIIEIENSGKEALARMRAEMTERLNEVSVKLAASSSAAVADEDRVERTRVRSPVDGIVKTLHTHTNGQIVQPGENIVEIVPIGENLLVQTNVTPRDIAFIFPEQKAVIKITAYDSSLFGDLEGRVKRIAADSVIDEHGNAFYKVDIQAEAPHLERNGKIFPVIPGMVAQVDIITGEKTVLNYLTKPIHRVATTAFQER